MGSPKVSVEDWIFTFDSDLTKITSKLLNGHK